MREYFRNARVIYSEARRALDLNERGESTPGDALPRLALAALEFRVYGFERANLSPIAGPIDRPIRPLFFRLFEFVARHGIPLAAETERRVGTSQRHLSPPIANARSLYGRRCTHSLATARRRRSSRDARYGAAAGYVPRMAEHFLPGCSGLLPSLHRGRAHAGHHRKAGGTGGQQRSRSTPAG